MKLARIVDPKFQETLRKLNQERLSLKVAFKLKGISKKVDDELNKYNELRITALEKFGDRDENGNLVLLEDGSVQLLKNTDNFVKELNDLLNLEIELDTIDINSLDNDLKMSVEELMYLDGLLV